MKKIERRNYICFNKVMFQFFEKRLSLRFQIITNLYKVKLRNTSRECNCAAIH